MLRKKTQERFLDILREHPLTEHSFEVTFSSSLPEMVKIRYLHNTEFYFTVGGDVEHSDRFWISRLPGEELLATETLSVESIGDALGSLSQWLRFVEVEDQIPEDSDSDIDQIKILFFRELARHVSDENKHFSSEEAAALKERIFKLEGLLEEMMKRQKKSDAEIEGLKKQFKASAKDVDTMTKKKWLLAGGGKIFNAMLSIVKSREARKALIDGVQKALQ